MRKTNGITDWSRSKTTWSIHLFNPGLFKAIYTFISILAYCNFPTKQFQEEDAKFLPPMLRLCLFFIPEFRSRSSPSSWVGDTAPDSQPIMAGTFSWRNCGNAPETHGQLLATKTQLRPTPTTGRNGALGFTKAVGILYEAVHDGCLELETLLSVGVDLLCTVSKVKKVGSQYYRQITAVHLILCTPAGGEKKRQNWRGKRKCNKVNHQQDKEINNGTFWTHCEGNQKSNEGQSGFCPAARKTAGSLQRSCLPQQEAAGPWERPPAARWAAPALAAPWRTASPDKQHHRGVHQTGTPHLHPISPGRTKHDSSVRPFLRVKGNLQMQRQLQSFLTLSPFRRTMEPDFLNKPSVSTCASSFIQASTKKLQNGNQMSLVQTWKVGQELTFQPWAQVNQHIHLPRHAPTFHIIVW